MVNSQPDELSPAVPLLWSFLVSIESDGLVGVNLNLCVVIHNSICTVSGSNVRGSYL